MLEVNEGVLPARPELPYGLTPLLEVYLRVPLIAQPEVAEVRGRLGRCGPFLGVGNAEGRVPPREQRVYILAEPRIVAELEGAAKGARKEDKQVPQPSQVFFEVGRELEEERPQLWAECPGGVDEVAERLVHVLEAGVVGDPPGHLEGKREPGRGLGIPGRDRFGVRHPVEGVVDLYRGEALRVVGEHLIGRELLGVEGAAPLRIVVPGCPDPDRHDPTLDPLLSLRGNDDSQQRRCSGSTPLS